MTEVVSKVPVLSDSKFKTRPQIDTYFRPDSNAGSNIQRQIEDKRRLRQMKFPSLCGRKDTDSFQTGTSDALYPSFKKFNDSGDARASAPYRSFDNIIDPVSGFVSIGGDFDRNTNVKRIPCLVQLNTTPQSMIPREVNSIRKGAKSAPPETNRLHEWDPPGPYEWNSRVLSDRAIRSALGGWTSSEDPRKVAEKSKQDPFKVYDGSDAARQKRDQLALKYMYTSSTQRQYQDIDWDANLPNPRKWPPTHTFEERPDMISYWASSKRAFVPVNDWQEVGTKWDSVQNRYGYYENRPVTYSTPCPRASQIPGYSGCIGARNIEEIDNKGETFNPFSVKRGPIPRPAETAFRPNMPGYSGCTLYRTNRQPAHVINPIIPPQQTTANVHKEIPVTPNNSEHKHEGPLSKMVTTVPPCNPFNRREEEEVDI